MRAMSSALMSMENGRPTVEAARASVTARASRRQPANAVDAWQPPPHH